MKKHDLLIVCCEIPILDPENVWKYSPSLVITLHVREEHDILLKNYWEPTILTIASSKNYF